MLKIAKITKNLNKKKNFNLELIFNLKMTLNPIKYYKKKLVIEIKLLFKIYLNYS